MRIDHWIFGEPTPEPKIPAGTKVLLGIVAVIILLSFAEVLN